MKYIAYIAIWACAVNALASCVSVYKSRQRMKTIHQCIEDQVNLYGDLCRESQQNFEGMDAFDAHYEGVKCAAESIKICIEGI